MAEALGSLVVGMSLNEEVDPGNGAELQSMELAGRSVVFSFDKQNSRSVLEEYVDQVRV